VRPSSRLVACAAAAVAGLAFAGTASALDLKLVVGTGTPGLPSTSLSIAFDRGPAAVGRVQVYIPKGYTLKAPTQPGTKLGSADGIVYITDVKGEDHMQGTLSVANPGDALLAKGAQGCDEGPHAASWVVNITGGAGGYWNFPVFLDRTTGSETQFGEQKLVICPTAPDVPSAHPKRSPNGERLISLNLNLTVLTNPAAAGDVRWRATATPFAPGLGTLDAAGRIEAQSLLSLPQRISFTARRNGKSATVTGKLTANGKPLAGVLVQIEVSKTKKRLTPFDRVRTSASGTFTKSFRVTGTRYFRANVTLGQTDLGKAACTQSFGAAVPCVGASSGGTHLLSGVIRVR
jgi:hypothetical protein